MAVARCGHPPTVAFCSLLDVLSSKSFLCGHFSATSLKFKVVGVYRILAIHFGVDRNGPGDWLISASGYCFGSIGCCWFSWTRCRHLKSRSAVQYPSGSKSGMGGLSISSSSRLSAFRSRLAFDLSKSGVGSQDETL